MESRVPHAVSQERLERLVVAIQHSALENNRRLVGRTVPVLFEGPSKRDARILSGRTPGNKVAHAPVPEGALAHDFAGRLLDVRIDEAQTWFVSGAITGNNP